ncbi:MAG: O-antigen ligase family protein [Clostridiales bacterium]|nr:O-antigen ligase family protein [Clostridiales bacterium]
MEKVLPLPIMNRKVSAHAVRRHSVSFVASVAWLLYVIILSYVKAFFYDDEDSVYYIQIIPMLLILFYQLYYLLKDVDFSRYRLNLIAVYFIFIILHYFLLRSGLERVVNLMTLLSCLLIYKKYPFKKKEINKLYYLVVAVVFLKVLNGTTVENMADTSKFNPNECAIYLMLLLCISLVMFANKKKIGYLIVMAICFALQFYFASRGALVGCILFVAAFVLFKAWKRTWKVKNAFIIILLLSVFGVLVAYLYSTVLFDLIGHGKITILGKDLFTGRQKIWRLTFDSIRENLWFGVGSHVNESTIIEESNELYRNAHNMPLAVLVSFGLIHFILFYWVFSRLVAESGAFVTRKGKYVNRTPIIFMGVITLMNYFEVLFFSQWAMPIVIVAFGFICNCQRERRQKNRLPYRKDKQVSVG